MTRMKLHVILNTCIHNSHDSWKDIKKRWRRDVSCMPVKSSSFRYSVVLFI
jgi:hypothetical protein